MVNAVDLNSKKIYLPLLLLVGSLIFLYNLGGRDLWDPDETRYAVVAREMRENGNWILPHLNGRIYAEKPPLFFWLVNFSVFFLGEDSEFANRLPSVLAGVITLLVTFLFGTRLFNIRVGFLSGLILSTCVLFPQISRWMMLDSLFTLFFLLSLFYFYRGYETIEKQKEYYILAGVFIGLGVLTKGPAIYLTIFILLIYSFIQQKPKKAWNRNLLFGFILSLTLVSLWLIPACWMGGEIYRDKILFEQNLGRLAGAGRHFHPQSIFFYFIRFPLEFLPWTFFLPTAFIGGLRNEKTHRKAFLFLIVWFATVFLFFTLSKGKKDNYILPLYPAASLMAGVLWDLRIDSGGKDKKLLLPLISLASCFLLIFIGVLFKIPDRFYPDFSPYHSLSLVVSASLLAGLLLSTLFLVMEKRWFSFVVVIVTLTFLHLDLSYALPKRLNEQRSMKAFSERILKRMEPGDELKVCFFRPTGLIYYTRKPFVEEIRDVERFHKVFELPQKVYLVIQKRDLDQFKKGLKTEIIPVEQTRVGHWDLVLISNR